MQLLTASPIPEECRRYWALGGLSAALDALVQDSHAGRISMGDAYALALHLPLLALEDSARRTAFSRLQDATQDDRFMDAVLHVTRGDMALVPLLQLRAAQYWMRLVYDATGQTSHTVAPALAASLRSTELHGYTCDDVRLPVRALHLVVPPEAGLELPDSLLPPAIFRMPSDVRRHKLHSCRRKAVLEVAHERCQCRNKTRQDVFSEPIYTSNIPT